MSDNQITLTVFNLKKSEANAIVKAMNKLVKLGQIEDKDWAMNTDGIDELDSNVIRQTKKQNKKEAPKKLTQEMVLKALKDFPL